MSDTAPGPALGTALLEQAGLSSAFERCVDLAGRARVASDVIDLLYTAYHQRARAIPALAQAAFETCDWQRSLELSRERMAIFGWYRDAALDWFRRHAAIAGNGADDQEAFWEATYRHHLERIAGTYQGDVAYAFLGSTRRSLTSDRWRVVDYSYARATGARRPLPAERPVIHREITFQGPVGPDEIDRVLEVPGFNAPFRDRTGDCRKVAQRINRELAIDAPSVTGLLRYMVAGFFRNRGAYLVGSIDVHGQRRPFALALLNGASGIHVDAVILDSDRLRYIFSSSLANFHATNPNFHEVIDFLFDLMPQRPRGLHYSTIGYNHVGKLAVMRQIEAEMRRGPGLLDYAPGPRGSVAIGFTAAQSGYVIKIIRDHPTDQYKWGRFPGIDNVLAKYRQVHELNRAGSMLDNVIYHNTSLPRSFLADALAEELLTAASENVALQGQMVVFRHLIVQMKLVPLPEFLKSASLAEAEQAIDSLGRCIKNNAAANVFNKDLDGRNYGVGRTRKVFLFDYDAVEPLTDVKVRSNADRVDGEEDIPDWFFEDGIVFLPEEVELHLRIEDRHLRDLFRSLHGDLLTPAFWLQRQAELRAGQVPRVTTYPDECRI